MELSKETEQAIIKEIEEKVIKDIYGDDVDVSDYSVEIIGICVTIRDNLCIEIKGVEK